MKFKDCIALMVVEYRIGLNHGLTQLSAKIESQCFYATVEIKKWRKSPHDNLGAIVSGFLSAETWDC